MKVLVTGASGNLGSALLRALTARGHEVHGVARRPPSPERGLGATWTALDLAAPAAPASLRPLVEGADAVVNLAWAFHPMRRPDYLHRASVGILEKVARVALADRDTHLVHVSSVAAYAPRTSPVRVPESWPLDGIPGATYSRLKVEAEGLLRHLTAAAGAEQRVAVLRPCLVGQRLAGGPMLRCGAPAVVPGRLLRRVPVVPVDERFGIQLVHADDVADALARVLELRASGPFNVAAEPVLAGRDIARALRARAVPLRQEHARAVVGAAWRLHLHPLDPGWVDMALQAPWVDTGRAQELLAWRPRHDGQAVLRELVEGMASGAGTSTAALRPRSVREGVRGWAARGSVARRLRT